MTTIAYKDGVVAYDGRCSQGGTVITDEQNKKHAVGDNLYFVASSPSDGREFAEAHWEGRCVRSDYRAAAIIITPTGVLLGGVDDTRVPWHCPLEGPVAVGSGADHALTAMDMGASAEDGVRMACYRDLYTGGLIRVCKLTEANRE